MVYRGKPSQGCELCRRRKIRCDQSRPSCGQCIKHGAPCPGYRDLATSNFLDESQAVIRRAQSKRRTSSPTFAIDTSRSSSANISDMASTLGPLARSPPAMPVEDKALAFFFSSFVLPGFILFLPDRNRLQHAEPILRTSLLCTALAAFANKLGTHEELVQARKRYARALLLTNAALRDVEQAKKHQTVAAVLLLGLFENLDCDNVERMTSWQAHIRGCSALLRLHDPSILLSPVGFELFCQIRPLILVNSIWDRTPVASHWKEFLSFSDRYHSSRQRRVNSLVWVCIDLAQFRSDTGDGTITEPVDMYLKAKALDTRLEEWEASASTDPLWKVDVVHDPSADPACVWEGTYHKYHDFGVSMMWTIFYSMRIILGNEMGFRLLQMGADPDFSEQISIAKTRSRLFNDIMSGVPYKLGFGPLSSPANKKGRSTGQNTSRSTPFPTYSAYAQQISLFFVGESLILVSEEGRDECDFQAYADAAAGADRSSTRQTIIDGRQHRYSQLQWIIGRFRHIGQLGIRQGAMYAQILQRKWNPRTDQSDPRNRIRLWKNCRNIKERIDVLKLTQNLAETSIGSGIAGELTWMTPLES